MPDFLDQTRNEIGERLKQLRPAVEEYARLEAASAALGGVPVRANGTPPRRAKVAKPTATAAPKRGRPKGSGARGAEALALVKANPGIKVPGLAEKMGIKPNYLYRVLPELAEQGLVRKAADGGWVPRA